MQTALEFEERKLLEWRLGEATMVLDENLDEDLNNDIDESEAFTALKYPTYDTYDFEVNDFIFESDLTQTAHPSERAQHTQLSTLDLHDVKVDSVGSSKSKPNVELEDPYYEQFDEENYCYKRESLGIDLPKLKPQGPNRDKSNS
ncbi:hypothetical protein TorRG33x02_259880 [Trema orientale]|uniref:Uncharacterized protein n=1 Tax=Trema orientale TaxID=63057 RepID=A0A2P5D782_TREOI|nr:hypothetical protein TorRG33x02_259880 [Trema orientale]